MKKEHGTFRSSHSQCLLDSSIPGIECNELQSLCLVAVALWSSLGNHNGEFGTAHGSIASSPNSLVPLDFL